MTNVNSFNSVNGQQYPTCTTGKPSTWGGADSQYDCTQSAPLYSHPYYYHRTIESKNWLNDVAVPTGVLPSHLGGDGIAWEHIACNIGPSAYDDPGAGSTEEYVQEANTNSWDLAETFSTWGNSPWSVSITATEEWDKTQKMQEDVTYPAFAPGSTSAWMFWGETGDWSAATVIYSGAPVDTSTLPHCSF